MTSPAASTPPNAPLNAGTLAPDFRLRCVYPGGRWGEAGLGDSLQQGRWATLVFFPMAFSPGCTAQVPAYSKLAGEFAAAGSDLYALGRENPYVLREWTRQLGLEVPLLSDLTLKVAAAYGVALPDYGVSRRATFVINPAGQVAFAYAEADSRELTLEVPEVLAWLRKQR